jgi:hypothetical protein
MRFEYEQQFDILYVIFNDDPEVYGENVETDAGDVVRFDGNTGMILDVTLFAFTQRIGRGASIDIPQIGAIPFSAIMQNITHGAHRGHAS